MVTISMLLTVREYHSNNGIPFGSFYKNSKTARIIRENENVNVSMIV